MQPLDPLCIKHVRLGACPTTRKLPRFDHPDLETLGFEELKQRNPVNAGGFQRDGFYTAFL